MPSDELKEYATSQHDFYALLGVTFEKSESDIKRAYHKAVLKYHPDKNHGNPTANLERFHLVQTAYAVLTDPAVKAAYDNARTARIAKERQKQLFEGKRRKMAEDLEMRERGVKRGREEDGEDAEERLAREVRRLAERGRKMRQERDEAKRASLDLRDGRRTDGDGGGDGGGEGDGDVAAPEAAAAVAAAAPSVPAQEAEADPLPELDRTVRLRWPADAAVRALDKERLGQMFTRFGPVEAVIPIKEKRVRVPGKREKQVMATSCIVFASRAAAHVAVTDAPQLADPPWTLFESISWAADTARRPSPGAQGTGDSSTASTPASTPLSTKGSRIRTATLTPSGSPSFEATMKRLKEAEKNRVEAEMRKRDGPDQDGSVDQTVIV